MSARATFWAWQQDIKPASAKLVLLCLADCHNGDTSRCNPSSKYIARQTGLDRKTVLNALATLEKIGAIRSEKANGSSTQYTIETSTEIGTAPAQATSTENGTGTDIGTGTKNGTRPVPKTVPPPVPKSVPEPKREPKKNLNQPQSRAERAPASPTFDARQIPIPKTINAAAWGEWCEYRIRKRKPITERAAQKCLALLARYPWSRQQDMVDEAIRNDWQGLFAPKDDHGGKRSTRDTQLRDELEDRSWAAR